MPLIFAFETAHEDRTKLKWFLAEESAPGFSVLGFVEVKPGAKKYDRNFV